MPFSNARQLNRHFAEHGSEFGAATPQDYEQMADLFLKAPQSLSIRQCRRARGDLIRFDPVSGAYGVLDQNNNVRTFSGRFHAPRWQLRKERERRPLAVAMPRLTICYISVGLQKMVNMCPVCGYGMEDPPQDYNICPSCRTEFGLHDANNSIAALRAAWLRAGAHWWSCVDPEPQGWDPYLQTRQHNP
jgi:hypothetical protein